MNTLPTGTRLLLPSGKRGTITGTSMWDSSIYEVKIDGHDDERSESCFMEPGAAI